MLGLVIGLLLGGPLVATVGVFLLIRRRIRRSRAAGADGPQTASGWRRTRSHSKDETTRTRSGVTVKRHEETRNGVTTWREVMVHNGVTTVRTGTHGAPEVPVGDTDADVDAHAAEAEERAGFKASITTEHTTESVWSGSWSSDGGSSSDGSSSSSD